MGSPLRVAVVTPYYKETPEVLRQCHDSVLAQTHPATHYMVADGHPQGQVAGWDAKHIQLPDAHGDNGNAARAIGSVSAINQGYDVIAYLDADNWYREDHLERMIALHHERGAVICSSNRTMHRLDGSLMYCDVESDGVRFVDTSNLVLMRDAFRLTALWGMMPKKLSPICDRIFWQAVLASKLPRAHDKAPTVAFRSRYADHYRICGEASPADAVTSDAFQRPMQWWKEQTQEYRHHWSSYFATGQWR